VEPQPVFNRRQRPFSQPWDLALYRRVQRGVRPAQHAQHNEHGARHGRRTVRELPSMKQRVDELSDGSCGALGEGLGGAPHGEPTSQALSNVLHRWQREGVRVGSRRRFLNLTRSQGVVHLWTQLMCEQGC
jgi:hypothetical protein